MEALFIVFQVDTLHVCFLFSNCQNTNGVMASKSADRRFCIQLLKDSNSDRLKFIDNLQNELQCELPSDVAANVFRDVSRNKENIRKSKKVDLDKILLNKGEGISFKELVNLEDQSDNTQKVAFSFPTPAKKRKHITECKRHSLYERTNELYSELKHAAEAEEIAPSRLAARVLARCVFQDDGISTADQHFLFDLCDNYFSHGSVQHRKLPTPVALAIASDCDLGREKYNTLRTYIDSGLEKKVMPTWKVLHSHMTSITPETIKLNEQFDGFSFPLYDSVQLTLCQILKNTSIDLSEHTTLCFQLKSGLDGSGNHKIFHQISSPDTNNMILTVMAPLCIKSSISGETLWSCSNPNSANVHRPLILQSGKESKDNLMTARALSEKMVQLEETGLLLPDTNTKVKVEISLSCFDRKAADTLQGTGGTFCDLCCFSDNQCQTPDNLDEMKVTRSVESAQEIFNLLVDEDGEIRKEAGDYEIRQGQTQEPILRKNMLSAQPLHARLRGLDFYVKLVTHLRAGLNPKSKSFRSETKLRPDLRFIKQAKEEIQGHLREKTGIKLDIPDGVGCGGTTTTGNVARRIFNNDAKKSQDAFIDCVPQEYKEKVASLIKRHGVILNTLNSKRQVCDIELLKSYSLNVYRDILTWFPNAHVTPTVHKTLAHAWELIKMNDNYGLGAYSEEGLESCNKLLRKIRISLSRKTNKDENQIDCIRRLWFRSDPEVNFIRSQALPFCKKCNTRGHGTRYCPSSRDLNEPSSDYEAFFVSE